MNRPRTAEEMAALPVGPEFGQTTRVIDGREARIPVMRAVQVFWSEDADILGYTDSHGQQWHLGCYADGQWFRRR